MLPMWALPRIQLLPPQPGERAQNPEPWEGRGGWGASQGWSPCLQSRAGVWLERALGPRAMPAYTQPRLLPAQLYNEEILDLFDSARDPDARHRKSHIKIHEDASGSIYTTGVTSRLINSQEEVSACGATVG